MKSSARTVTEYLEGLPEDRRAAIAHVRKVIRKNLPRGYKERVNYGMLTYEVPLSVFADTYNGQPLPYVCLASQKRHMSLYLMDVYSDPKTARRFRDAYKATGKRLDMGKSCVRFTRIEDLPLDLVAKTVAQTSVKAYIARCRALRPAKAGARSTRRVSRKRRA
jgi:hypothetical protein